MDLEILFNNISNQDKNLSLDEKIDIIGGISKQSIFNKLDEKIISQNKVIINNEEDAVKLINDSFILNSSIKIALIKHGSKSRKEDFNFSHLYNKSISFYMSHNLPFPMFNSNTKIGAQLDEKLDLAINNNCQFQVDIIICFFNSPSEKLGEFINKQNAKKILIY